MTNEAFDWAIPAELDVPADPLRLRLDFHYQAVVMTSFRSDMAEKKIVSALDISHALASELSFGTGLLPRRTLWWKNTRSGPVYALYEEPRVRKVAVQEEANKPPRRLTIPLPGLVFLCRPGTPPWVYAVKKVPTKETDIVYKSPLLNILQDGRSCPGNNKYPTRAEEIIESFFISFFSLTADKVNRSLQFPRDILHLWEFLDKKKTFPNADLVKHGTVGDLMHYE